MAINLAPSLDMGAIGQAANVAGLENRRRSDEQHGLNVRRLDQTDAEMALRKSLTFADMAFKEALQQQNYAEAAKAREFSLKAQKEIDALRYAENQKAREFDFGARTYLQDDQQQFGAQQQTQQLAYNDYAGNKQIAASQWQTLTQQAAREREMAAQIAAQQQRDIFGYQTDMTKMGYGAYLNDLSADQQQQNKIDLMPLQTQQALDLYGGQLTLQQQQQNAQIDQQIKMVENNPNLSPATKTEMIRQLEDKKYGVSTQPPPGNYLPIIDPTTNKPLIDPGTGLPLLRDPVTGQPIKLPATPAKPPAAPPDNTKLVKDIADSIMGSSQPGTKSYSQAWIEAQEIVRSGGGGGGAPSPMGGSGALDAPFRGVSGGAPTGFNQGAGAFAPQPVPTNPAQLVSGQVYGPTQVNGEWWMVRWTGQAFEGVQKVQ